MSSLVGQKFKDLVGTVGVPALAAGLIFSYIAFRVLYNIYFHPLRSYPGPYLAVATPLTRIFNNIIGQEARWLVRLHRKYGPVVRVSPNELSYTSSESWKDIYAHGSKLAGRKWIGLYNPKIPQLQSIQGASDEEHPRLRRIFSKAFSENALREQQPLLKMYAERLVKRLQKICDETPSGEQMRVDMTAMYAYMTSDFMGDMAFGQEMHMIEDMKMLVWLKRHLVTIKLATIFQLGTYFPLMKPLVDAFLWLNNDAIWTSYNIVTEWVEKRMAMKDNADRRDIWSFVMRDQELNEMGRKLSTHEMRTHGLLFMFAGTETTATLLTGLTYLLLAHPEKMEKLKNEIRTSFKSTDDMNMINLQELTYLHGCIEEAFRIYPPVPAGLPRVTPPEGAVIDGKFVPPNVIVYTSQLPAYKLESNFRNPEEFIPDRWSSPEYKSDDKSVLQPFIIGQRNCIGKPLAYHEIRLVMSYILWHFDLKLVNPNEKWIDEQKVYVTWDKTPLMINLTPVRKIET